MIDPSPSELPSWIGTLLGIVFGAGGVRMVSVWLENKRLTRKDYRETLQELIQQQSVRIGELEQCVARLQVRIGNLRVEMVHLEAENRTLSGSNRKEDDGCVPSDGEGNAD